jgi:hypothetical protein
VNQLLQCFTYSFAFLIFLRQAIQEMFLSLLFPLPPRSIANGVVLLADAKSTQPTNQAVLLYDAKSTQPTVSINIGPILLHALTVLKALKLRSQMLLVLVI